jgi:hypothetical protein
MFMRRNNKNKNRANEIEAAKKEVRAILKIIDTQKDDDYWKSLFRIKALAKILAEK